MLENGDFFYWAEGRSFLGGWKEGEGEKKRKEERKTLNPPTLDEILEVFAPFDAVLRFILQLGDRLTDDIGEEIDQARAGLHFGTVRGERKPVLGHFEKGNAQGPHVRGDGVGLAGDSFRSHVVRGADERVGVALGAKLPADAKVTELHLAVSAKEDVGGFDVYSGQNWKKPPLGETHLGELFFGRVSRSIRSALLPLLSLKLSRLSYL